jgi:phosphoglycerol transferase MdoB-like AlkP superfamily enzyme
VQHEGPAQRLNVIQITVESLSANFLSTFNRASHLTPNLDRIAQQSLVFDQFYATGTRTDRGMEALTLSVPPTPGRSLVKRPNNEHLFTLGSVFRSQGYGTEFIYGGFGYFDNMNYFFGQNGYAVVDRTKVSKSDVTFANVWGACDEDLFRWTTRDADRDAAAGKPFFYFVMTTSNHRPFTYPEGKIDLPPKISGRAGGVKYSDYAIGEFFRIAATKPWFNQTVFVIVGDHCASSAGKTELPVENYHIPLIIYAPGGQVKPGTVHTLTSQVDYAPTLLGLLRWTYASRFYGHDVLAQPADTSGRALLGNYQKLGLYTPGKLTVLKPVGESLAFTYDSRTHEMRRETPNTMARDDAIAYYQTASWIFKHGLQHALTPDETARANAAAATHGVVTTQTPASTPQ